MKANDKFVEIKIPDGAHQKGFMADPESQILEGVVVSVGSEVKEIKKGNKVIFDKYKSQEALIEGKKHYFTLFNTILAIQSIQSVQMVNSKAK